MSIATVIVADISDPVELQGWFTDHPEITLGLCKIILQNNIFYILTD